MAQRADLMEWTIDALKQAGGKATIVYIAKYIWDHHADDMRKSENNLFYTWQYDMRWAAKKLRDLEILAAAKDTNRGEWALK